MLGVELTQLLLVEFQTVGIVGGLAKEGAQQARLVRLDDRPQPPVGKRLVPGEADPLDAGHPALVDLEHRIHAVLGQADDDRIDGGVVAPGRPVGVDDALRIGLGGGCRVGKPWLQLHYLGQLVIVDLVVALEGDLIDRRVFLDGDNETAGLGHHLHVLEQARLEKIAHREVELLGRDRLAGLDPGKHPDRIGLDTLVPRDVDPTEDRRPLGERQCRWQDEHKEENDDDKPGETPEPWPLHHSAPCPSARRAVRRPVVNSPCA